MCLFLFWWTSRDCALDFCKAFCAYFFLVPCKSLRSSLKTTPRVVFLTRRGPQKMGHFLGCHVLVRLPSLFIHAKEKETHCASFSFGGLEGSRTPVRKFVDMTFFVDSQSLCLPSFMRRLTDSKKTVALLCLTDTAAALGSGSLLLDARSAVAVIRRERVA